MVKKIILLLVLCFSVSGYFLYRALRWTHTLTPTAALAFTATGDEFLDAIGRGVARLTQFQETDGAFVQGRLAPRAAITAAVLEALTNLPPAFLARQTSAYRERLNAIINAAQTAILAAAQPDGGIYTDIPGFSFGVYSTAYSLTALRNSGLAAEHPTLQKAQKYLLAAQHHENGLYLGGVGYQPQARPDLSNTTAMLEALAASGLSAEHPAYQNALRYVENCQNRSESNLSGIAVTDDGGFFYAAAAVATGKETTKNRDGDTAYASYGSMSYAGLVAFLYAAVDKNDPRVQAAFKWVQAHYDLHENVGRKSAGLYYYYRIMAKALTAYGEKIITTPDGVAHAWRAELAAQLVKLQRPDGGWYNDDSRYLENDEVLVSAYVLRALALCVGKL